MKYAIIKGEKGGDKNMDIAAITSLIGTLGFPIVACIFMAVFMWKMIKQNQEYQKEMEGKQTAAIEKMSEALVKNTEKLTEIYQKIDNFINNEQKV